MSATIFPPDFNAGPETPRGKCWAKFGRAKFEALPWQQRADEITRARCSRWPKQKVEAMISAERKAGRDPRLALLDFAPTAPKPAAKAPRKLSAFEREARASVAKVTTDPQMRERLVKRLMAAQHAPAPVAPAAPVATPAPPAPQLHGLARAIAAHRQQPEIRAEREAREKRIATNAKK